MMLCTESCLDKVKSERVPRKPPAFYVPVALDVSAYPPHWWDSIHYFLNLIHWRRANYQADEDGFVYLKYDYLTKVIDRPIWKAMEPRLEGDGVIECDGLYRPGEKSLGYRLCNRFRQTHRIVCESAAFSEKVLRVQRNRDKVLLPVHEWLRNHFDDLDFDVPMASQIISTMTPNADCKLSLDEYRQLIDDNCQMLAHRDHWLKRDSYGRVHTPITSLPKELRSCLSVGGKRLVGVDLANSQPLIAGICAHLFHRNPMSKSRLVNAEFSESDNPYRYRTFSDLENKAIRVIRNNALEAQNGSATPIENHPDLQMYLEVCESGLLYELLMEPGEDRHEFKKEFFRDVFFGSSGGRRRLKSRFEKMFPSVAHMLRELKRKDHRRSAWVMQTYESTIFIYIIGNRIRHERPELPIFTVHDSFLTVPSGIGYVEATVQDVFKSIGIRPTLRRETY